MIYVYIAAALASIFAALLLAWQGWKSPDGARWRTPAVLALAALSGAIWIGWFGAEVGIALALETAALVAFAFILSRIERRADRVRRERRIEAPLPQTKLGRGALRVLIGGPLGLIAALGIGIVVGTRLPVAEQTRLILGGLIVPSFWCAAMVWSATAQRIARPAIGFVLAGAAGLGGAFLLGN